MTTVVSLDLHALLIDPITRREVTLSRCPVHTHGKGRGDRNRSLETCRGEKGWLVICRAGCSLKEITGAWGIRIADLFFDRTIDPAQLQRQRTKRETARLARERQQEQDSLQIDAYREAESTIAAASGIDISHWSNEQLDAALNVLADAYAILETEHRP
jgi:hypothetical protein